MPAIAITAATAARDPNAVHPKAVLVDADGRRFVFPFLPREVDYEGGYPEWVTLNRPGRKPILRRSGTSLRVMALEALIARRDHQDSVEDLLSGLGAIARGGERCTFSAGPAAAGVWRVTNLATRTELLRQGDNAITRARVTLTLTEAVDGPVGPKPKGRADKVRFYTVRKGDTLGSIAARFYGSRAKWRVIADAQKPKLRRAAQLKVGMRLRIPPK